MNIKDKEVLTIKQVADYLQLNYYTVYRMVTSGELLASKIGKTWRIMKKDILEYLEKTKSKS